MNKAVFINLDNTLITTLSGRVFSLHSEDWKLCLSLIPYINKKIREGYKLIIISNQESIALGHATKESFTRKLELVCKTIERDLKLKKNTISYTFCTFLLDDYMKMPNPGMAYEMALEYELSLKDCVMVGSDICHKKFASNVGMNYIDTSFIFEPL